MEKRLCIVAGGYSSNWRDLYEDYCPLARTMRSARVKPGNDSIAMTPSRIHRLSLTHFRNYRAASSTRAAMWWRWSGRTARARPIAWRRSRSCRRGAACGGRRWRMSPTTRATAPGRSPPRSRARWGSQRSAPASMRRQARQQHQPPLPHRPRAGRLGHRVRRSFAHGMADAGDGRAVPWRSVGTAAVLRPAGAGDRQRAFQPRLRAGALAALAQPAARSAQL